jgi:hypothetical protein
MGAVMPGASYAAVSMFINSFAPVSIAAVVLRGYDEQHAHQEQDCGEPSHHSHINSPHSMEHNSRHQIDTPY